MPAIPRQKILEKFRGMIAAGTPVKVIGHRGSDLLVIEA